MTSAFCRNSGTLFCEDLGGRREAETGYVSGVRGNWRFLGHDSDHGNFDSVEFFDHVWFQPFQSFHVCTQDRKPRIRDPLLQNLLAEIELMVSHDQRIKIHGVHQLHDGFTLGKVRPVMALNHVAGRQKKRGFFSPKFHCSGRKIRHPPKGFLTLKGSVGFGKAVKVVEVEDPDFDRLSKTRGNADPKEKQGAKDTK